MALKSGIGLKITLFQTLILTITIGIMSYVSISSFNEISSLSFIEFKSEIIKQKKANHKNNLTQLSHTLNQEFATIESLCVSLGKQSQQMLNDKQLYSLGKSKGLFTLQENSGRMNNSKESLLNIFYAEERFNKSGYSSKEIDEYNKIFTLIDPQIVGATNSFPYIKSSWLITASTLERHYPNINVSAVLPHAKEHSIQMLPFYKIVKESIQTSQKPYWFSEQDKNQISVFSPIYENGELFGAIGFDIGTPELSSILKKLNSDSAFNIILDKNQKVIYNSQENKQEGILALGAKFSIKNKKYNIIYNLKDSNNFTFEQNGERFYCLKEQVATTSWTIIHAVPEKALTSSFNSISNNYTGLKEQLQNTYLTLTAVIVFLALFMSYYLLKFFIFIPLNNINKSLLDVREGKYDTYLPEDNRNDELSQIAISFNAMNQKLRENNQLVLNQQKELEKKVEERTSKFKKAKEEAISANRSKSQFLANMSHEIRTPMNAILGFTQLLDRKLEDPKMITYLNSISDSGNILLRLIDDILDISKVEAGKLVLQYSTVNMSQICYSLDVMFGSLAREKGLNFDVMIDEKIPTSLKLDEIRVRQVITNLLSNAIKFTEIGKVELNIKVLKSSEKYIDLNISVVDTGCGIPEKNKEKIFDAFEQVSGQQQKEFGGTGLGLAISKSLVELMNGTIECTSQDQKGSNFSVTLHDVDILDKPIAKKKLSETVIIPNLRGKVILVAEDISFNKDLIKSYLQDTSATLKFASDGVEAIEKFKEINPDLILMDLKMPKMGGIQAASIIQNLQSSKKTPIIFITASAMINEYDQNKILCDSLLSKPVRRNELIEEISKYLISDDAEITSNQNTDQTMSLEDKMDLITDNELLTLLSKDTKGLQAKAMKSLQLSHIQDFYDAMINIADSYNNDLIKDYMFTFKESFNNYDMKNVEIQLAQFDKLLDNLIASHQN